MRCWPSWIRTDVRPYWILPHNPQTPIELIEVMRFFTPPAGVEFHNPDLHIATLNSKGKFELEAMCEALGLDPKGTRADLIVRILKAKEKRKKKR